MPDFEIRYYHADGKLALVHICAYRTEAEAEEFAQNNMGDHARFEIVDRQAQPSATT
ncbi:MAG: hypothetical protein JSR55_05710 [Proteobacteria bacterium]|nr:hypothetical protein [Pseudomonadota bacterium]